MNKIWGAFFLVAFLIGLVKTAFLGDYGVWAAMVSATFDMAKVGFEIALGLNPLINEGVELPVSASWGLVLLLGTALVAGTTVAARKRARSA